tara:strand:- start:15 stop:1829 length:1815 start_codon:yes stop_codon:yes gene_type:complete
MLKSILIRFSLVLAVMFSITKLSAADTTDVAWDATPGAWESFIMGDTTSTGEQNADVYRLESSKVHLQVNHLKLYYSCEIIGASYDESAGGFPATIQQIPGADGTSQMTNWPASNVLTYGAMQTYKLHNLLFNQAMADQSGSTFGVLATYGEDNTIIVDHVTSVHSNTITYFNFGQREHWTITNNTAVQYTCYPAGMYFGGFFWGGGSWTGTLASVHIQNNTIEGTHGQAFVLYSDKGGIGAANAGNAVVIDHNTFVNLIDWPKFYRDGNNTLWTNNLFVNIGTNGQTRNASNTNIALNPPGGIGKMATLSQGACTDSTLLADGECWDNMARNIHYEKNGWFDTPELINGIFMMDPWCWNLKGADGMDSTDANGAVVSLCDTMLTMAEQSRWMDDSTAAQIANNGVSHAGNIHAHDLGFNLDPAYINAQVGRTQDWLDNGVHDTYTDVWWNYQADGNAVVVEWPLPMDFSYSTSSAAYTHGVAGLPLGNLNVFPDAKAAWLSTDFNDAELTPSKFTLAQNYPNPFNPTTEISFSIDQNVNVNLSIYNMLGQKVRTLTNGSMNAGTHTLQWNGRDEMGQSVSTGIYLYTLTNGSETITKKMALMK